MCVQDGTRELKAAATVGCWSAKPHDRFKLLKLTAKHLSQFISYEQSKDTFFERSATDRTRTYDILLRRETLYVLSYGRAL